MKSNEKLGQDQGPASPVGIRDGCGDLYAHRTPLWDNEYTTPSSVPVLVQARAELLALIEYRAPRESWHRLTSLVTALLQWAESDWARRGMGKVPALDAQDTEDTSKMTEGEMVGWCADNARRWSVALMQRHGGKSLGAAGGFEHGDAIAWFANAIETAIAHRKRVERRLSASEAVFGVLAALTCRTEAMTFGRTHHAGPAAEFAEAFCKANGLDKPRETWAENLTHPPEIPPPPASVATPAQAMHAIQTRGGVGCREHSCTRHPACLETVRCCSCEECKAALELYKQQNTVELKRPTVAAAPRDLTSLTADIASVVSQAVARELGYAPLGVTRDGWLRVARAVMTEALP